MKKPTKKNKKGPKKNTRKNTRHKNTRKLKHSKKMGGVWPNEPLKNDNGNDLLNGSNALSNNGFNLNSLNNARFNNGFNLNSSNNSRSNARFNKGFNNARSNNSRSNKGLNRWTEWKNGNNYNLNNENENDVEEENENENDYETENTASYSSNYEEVDEEWNENDVEEENELKDLVDESTANKGTYCCAASSLSNISENIAAIEQEICNINTSYLTLLKRQLLEAYEVKRSRGGLYRSDTQDKWYESFKQIYMFQRYQQRDLLEAMRYMVSSSIDPNMNDLSTIEGAPKQIKRLIEEYAYKIISGHFTKASIGYAIYNFGRTYQPIYTEAPQEYIYLERCLNILQCAITTINIELQKRWSSFVEEDMDHSSYVLSGGNIFFVFAGVLCYLYDGQAQHPMLSSIENRVFAYVEQLGLSKDFRDLLNELFKTPEFTSASQSILINPSDIDCVYLPRKKTYVTHTNSSKTTIAHNINRLSAAVLRSMLTTAHSKSDQVTNLFPFVGLYDKDTWGTGRLYVTNHSLDKADITKLNAIGNISKYVGYRQTSGYIDELYFYLNRMKQGYYPYNKNEDPSSIGIKCMDEKRKEYMSKYGECIDLSVGSTANELYNQKHDYYLKGKYYSMGNLSHELKYIELHTDDDKSSKRIVRQTFLQILQESRHSSIFDFILMTIFEHIHTKDGTLYGYPCPMFDNPHHQIQHDII